MEASVAEAKIYRAKKIITMDANQPAATHVSVRDGRILAVGSLEDVSGWGEAPVDERFADKVLMPGLIDPHLHPSMAAVLLPMHFTTAME